MSKVQREIEKRSKESSEFAEAFQIENSRLNMAVVMTELRNSLGYTQSQFAKVVNIPQSTVSRLETGKMNPTVEYVAKIASKVGKKVKIEFIDF